MICYSLATFSLALAFTEALASNEISAEFKTGLDPVDVLILIAAKHREQLYELSR